MFYRYLVHPTCCISDITFSLGHDQNADMGAAPTYEQTKPYIFLRTKRCKIFDKLPIHQHIRNEILIINRV